MVATVLSVTVAAYRSPPAGENGGRAASPRRRRYSRM